MLRERGEEADIEPYREVLASFADWPVTPLWAAVFAAELGEGFEWAAAVDAAGPAFVRAYARVRRGEELLAEGDRPAARDALSAASTPRSSARTASSRVLAL